MSFIAPQAYTKETLAKAFDWLQHQPASLREIATSPDVLVGLFLKAQRQGITNIDADAPVSSKKFIDDLKNLKKDFAVFDEPQNHNFSGPIISTPSPSQVVAIEHPISAHTPTPPATNPSRVTFPSAPIFSSSESSPSYTMTSIQQTQTIHQTSVKAPELNLDEASLKHLAQIQERFNLSSTQEALRLAISVGAQQISRWT